MTIVNVAKKSVWSGFRAHFLRLPLSPHLLDVMKEQQEEQLKEQLEEQLEE